MLRRLLVTALLVISAAPLHAQSLFSTQVSARRSIHSIHARARSATSELVCRVSIHRS